MSLSAKIEEGTMRRFLVEFGQSGRSGELQFQAANGRGTLLIQDGALVGCRGTALTRTAAEVLTAAGIFVEADLENPEEDETVDDVLPKAVERAGHDFSLIERCEAALAECMRDFVAATCDSTGVFHFTERAVDDPDRPLHEAFLVTTMGPALNNVGNWVAQTELSAPAPVELLPAPFYFVGGDDSFVIALQKAISGRGFFLEVGRTAADALAHLARLTTSDEESRSLVSDLVMPRKDGRGILGGLSVLRAANELGLSSRVVLCSDMPHDDAESRIRELGGGGLVLKPAPRDIEAFVDALLSS